MDYSKGHSVDIKDRKHINCTGVKHVESYDDKEIVLETSMGNLIIKGKDLNIKNLNLEEGTLQVIGELESMFYAENAGTKRKNFLKRILK